MKAKERFAQATTGIGSNNQVSYGHGSSTPKLRQSTPNSGRVVTDPSVSAEIEQARPQTAGEEELQLQLALAMSKEEADQEKKAGDSDDIRLKMALSKSVENAKPAQNHQSTLLDLTQAAAQLNDPWGGKSSSHSHSGASPANDPFGLTQPVKVPSSASPPADPWGSSTAAAPQVASQNIDPWGAPTPAAIASSDPWVVPQQLSPNHNAASNAWGTAAPPIATSTSTFDPFGSLLGDTTTAPAPKATSLDPLAEFDTLNTGGDAFNLNSLNQGLPNTEDGTRPKKSANDFLGDAADLVNLDSLVAPIPAKQEVGNPFLGTGSTVARGASPTYQFSQPTQPSINQMRGGPSLIPTMGTTVPPMSLGNPGMMNPSPYGMQANPMAMPSYGVPATNPMMNYGLVGGGMGTGMMMPNGGMAMNPTPAMGMQPRPGVTQDNNNPFLL